MTVVVVEGDFPVVRRWYHTSQRLRCDQGLRDVRDQIVRVLDADRQPDRRVENSDVLADIGRDAGVRHARRQARKRLGAALAHRQLEYLQRVEEFECRSLAADDVEGERGARAGALPLEQTAGRRVLGAQGSEPWQLCSGRVGSPRRCVHLRQPFPFGCSVFRATG
jgi:hypothetical protein